MSLRIIGRRENEKGAYTHYKLSDGRIITRAEGVLMCERGKLPGYNVIVDNGVLYLKDISDTSVEDKIDSQPLI